MLSFVPLKHSATLNFSCSLYFFADETKPPLLLQWQKKNVFALIIFDFVYKFSHFFFQRLAITLPEKEKKNDQLTFVVEHNVVDALVQTEHVNIWYNFYYKLVCKMIKLWATSVYALEKSKKKNLIFFSNSLHWKTYDPKSSMQEIFLKAKFIDWLRHLSQQNWLSSQLSWLYRTTANYNFKTKAKRERSIGKRFSTTSWENEIETIQ